jgi:V/A-type H+-transporting ATPase subunit D
VPDVPLTKTSLLQVREELSFAREGFDLLEQKREILVLEVMHLVEAAKAVARELAAAAGDAYGALRRATVESGSASVWRAFENVRGGTEVAVTERRVIGVHVPTVGLVEEGGAMRPAYSLCDTTASADETRLRFRRLVGVALRMAEIQNAVIRLARELRKVQRRVNALEKVYIPGREVVRKFIEDHLAEIERESFFVRKMVKARGGRASRGEG